jgi:mannose-1-phosphate guanylyltransferase
MKTAMILCAGFGTRLKGYTLQTPKPMLPIQGKPVLEHTIQHLAGLDIKNIIINLHYLADQITSYFGDGKKWGVTITYSYENRPLGTAGAIKNVEHLLRNTPDFFVLYGDVICNENYSRLYDFHIQTKGLGTIIVHKRRKSNSIVEINSKKRVIRFLERPKQNSRKGYHWVNSGLYILKNEILDIIPAASYCDFPGDIFPLLVNQNQLYAYFLTGYRCAIDSPARYKQVQADFDKIRWNKYEAIRQNQTTSRTIF